MIVELSNGWIELDGEIVLSSSFNCIEEAEAHITASIRDEAIEHSMLEFISTVAKNWGRKSTLESDDLNNSIWAEILKLREDPNRWNVRYLKGKAVFVAKQIVKDSTTDLLPFSDEVVAPFKPDFTDLYELIDSINSPRQRAILRLTAKGLSPQAIADKLLMTVSQVRSAQSKGSSALRKKVSFMSPQQKEDLR